MLLLLGVPADGLISIHALREEGDGLLGSIHRAGQDFYPRPPRGGRLFSRPLQHGFQQFLSTPSARRATVVVLDIRDKAKISIHALREEGDCFRRKQSARHTNFYPRPPRGGRRKLRGHGRSRRDISIHALREEGDDTSTNPLAGSF